MLTTTVNLPTRRAPSTQIRARDTLNDGAANGSAGVNSAPDLGGCCRDHEDRGDSTNYRKLAEHNLSPPWLPLPLLRLDDQTSLAWDRGQAPQGRFGAEPVCSTCFPAARSGTPALKVCGHVDVNVEPTLVPSEVRVNSLRRKSRNG